MRLLIIVFSLFVLISCNKEAQIVPSLEFDNVYEIKSDTDDPVKMRVYDIYKKYKIPVFFNDTIGQVFVMNDVKGNPIYHTERVNLEWSFFGYEKTHYDYTYMSTNQEKLDALDIIEEFLTKSNAALHPFSSLVVKSARIMEQEVQRSQIVNGNYLIGFRSILMSGNWSAATKLALPESMKRDMVLNKINNYPSDVAEFGAVSTALWYGRKSWNSLDNSIPTTWQDANALVPTWSGISRYTAAELDQMRANARPVIGRFGFVRGAAGINLTPSNATEDLGFFVVEMLKYPHEEFLQLWGHSPLVIKKYNILKNLIENKMNVKL